VGEPAELTYRPTGPVLQDLAYRYDVAGNVLLISGRTLGSSIPGTALGAEARGAAEDVPEHQ
jgi:hypothetical protein